jgi:hypothetical protein
VNVLFRIGVPVMMAVVRCPPDWTLLGCGRSKHSEEELNEAAGIVGPMREISVIDACDGEHPNNVEEEADTKGYPAYSDP